MNPIGVDPTIATGLATDARALGSLSALAAKDPKAALRATARQLESLFMNELMKSMRATTLDTGAARQRGQRAWAPRCWTRSSPPSSAASRAGCRTRS